MRLIIKDYLSQLKEKDELDLLLCDIILQMGYATDNIPKTGNRQYGVDIRAHNEKEILLFVVKQGDLTRSNWNSDQNSVRPSLDEIQDAYLNYINGTDRNKKLRIIVATNGMMNEAVRPNWEGYREKNTMWDGIPVEIDFWNIDDITKSVQEYLFDEHIFDFEMHSLLRRALYFIGEGEYRREYYEQIIDAFISKLKDSDTDKSRKKKLSGLHLACQMIAYYGEQKGFFKIGIMVSEYLIIKYWKYLMTNEKLEKAQYIEWLIKYLSSYEQWNQKYYMAVKYCCESKNRLPLSNSVEQRVILYEMLGYLTSYAYHLCFPVTSDSVSDQKFQEVYEHIIQLVNNYPQILYPPFDNHIGVISMLYRLLNKCNKNNDIKVLIQSQSKYLAQYYRNYRKYPSPSDSFEDAVNIYMGFPAEEYSTSSLWGTMLVWIVLMDQQKLYDELQKFLSNDLSRVTKCTWFIKSAEEVNLYDYHAMYLSGEGVAFDTPNSFAKLKENIDFVLKQYEDDAFSFDTYSFDSLELILCRYYGYIPRMKREQS